MTDFPQRRMPVITLMRSLSKKVFTTLDGEPKTVLTKITRGCRGHCPHYEDTLGQLIAEGKYPPNGAPTGSPIEQPNGRQNQTPIDEPNGTPKHTPIDEFSTSNCTTKTSQMEHQNEPNGTPTGAPIETRQDIHITHTSTSLLPRTHDDLMAILMEGERKARERDMRESGDGNG